MIIETTKVQQTIYYTGGMPDQFVSDKDKEGEQWIKANLDFLNNEAVAKVTQNIKDFKHNYDLLNGYLDSSDFYQQQEISDFISEIHTSFTDLMEKELDLPSYVQHYDIMSRPLNTLKGELTKRADNSRVLAMDDDSFNEKRQFFTDLMTQLIISNNKQRMIEKGLTPESLGEEEFEKVAMDQIKDRLSSFTTKGEKWGNAILEAMKVEFNLKEQSEEGFQDLNTCAREYFHIYLDKSKTGFKTEVTNPIQTWSKKISSKKYTRDGWAAGLLEVMELSEIINKFDLTKEEIDYLRDSAIENTNYGNQTRSNLLGTSKTWEDSTYTDTYNPYTEDLTTMQEMEVLGKELDSLVNGTRTVEGTGYWGARYIVLTAYWCSKKKIGLLTYLDEDGEEQTKYVDDTYKKIPEQVSIEWNWINQWYRGLKIGDIYYAEPIDYISYCPIIGVEHNGKNSRPTSKVDKMKKFQALFNVAINQGWRILEKDLGVQYEHELKTIPNSKDGDDQDALEVMEAIMREKGMITKDTSPENVRGNLPNTATSKVVDLTRDRELKMRIDLATWAKQMCWEMVGMNEQRMGGVAATETAYGTQTALSQSYAQTEPDFAQHEYLMNQVYQAILDVAQWVAINKETSTLSWISGDGTPEFLEIAGDDLSLRDLRCIVTNRNKDQQRFNELRGLAQHMIQNGADEYAIAELYSTESIRELKETFKKLREKREETQQQQQQIEQQKIQQAQQAVQLQLQQVEQHHQEELQMEKYKADLAAHTRITEAQIKNYFQTAGEDADMNGIPDPQQIAANALKQQELIAKKDLEGLKLSTQQQKNQQDYELKQRELDVKEKDIAAKIQIAKENKGKYDNKKK